MGDAGVVEALRHLGGVSTRAALVAATSRRAVEGALAREAITLVAHGRLALPEVADDEVAAHRLTGRLCLLSAAQHWGWAVRLRPDRPQVVVPRNRNVARRHGADVRWADLGPDDVAGIATSRDRTLVDCLRLLPFGDALAVADSALRDGESHPHLVALARDCRGPGSRQARRVAAVADGRAANGFESALRAIALEVTGLRVTPQVNLYGSGGFLGRPDLVDDDLRIVLEADSFAWHGGRADLRRDARRYDVLAVHGWLVLRFAWEDVVHDPDWVADILRAAVSERARPSCNRCRAA